MRRIRNSIGAVLCGAASGGCFLALLTGSPGAVILVYLAPLPLFAAGLWQGAKSALLAGVTAALIVLAGGGEPAAAALFAASYAAPAVLLVRLALLARTTAEGELEWYPPGLLTAWLTAFGLAMIAVAFVVLGGAQEVRSALRTVLAPGLDRLAGPDVEGVEAFTDLIVFVAPGLAAASWMIMILSNGVLAQGVLARFGGNWRPSPPLAALGLPIWITVALAAAALAISCGGTARFIGVNVLIVLIVPFSLAGLAVLHTIAARLARPTIPLVTFYVLAGLFGWPILLTTLLGLVDAPLGLRRRFARPRRLGGRTDD